MIRKYYFISKFKRDNIDRLDSQTSVIYRNYDTKIVNKEISKIIPKYIKLDIIYEDNDILVINKPKGLVVHPGAGNHEDTLANALYFKYKDNL